MTQRERIYEYARIADVLRAEHERDAADMRAAFHIVATGAAALQDPPRRRPRVWRPYDAAHEETEPFDLDASDEEGWQI